MCMWKQSFSRTCAVMCKRGRFNLDNEIRDLTATLLTEVEVCHDISVEPGLQPISNEILTGATANTQDGARLDIAANGFQSVQSPCSVKQAHSSPILLQKARADKEMYVRTKVQRGGTCLVYPSSDLSHGRPCQRSHNILQKIGLNACLQMGHPLQQHTVLATMPTRFFTATLCNPVNNSVSYNGEIITHQVQQDLL